MKWTQDEPLKPGYYWRVDSNDPSGVEVVHVTFVTTKNPWTNRDEVTMEFRSKNIFTSVMSGAKQGDPIWWSDTEVPYPEGELGAY